MRGKRVLAAVLSLILAFPAAWGNTSMSLEAQAEEEQEQERRLENVRNAENQVTWIFADEEAYTVSLNTEGMENITEVHWEITMYQDGEPVSIDQLDDVSTEEIYHIDQQNYAITLNGEGLAQMTDYMRDNNQWFDLGVVVSYGENDSFEQWIGVFYASPEYQVTYLANQGEDQMLPNEDKYLPNTLEVFVWNTAHPYDTYEECQIVDMEILGQYTWDENGEEIQATREFFSLDGNAENGWNLHSEDHGFAELRAHYTDVDENDAAYDFRVWSIGEIYYLEVQYENDINNMLLNSKAVVNTRLTKNYQDENGENQYGVEVEDYYLKVSSGYEQDMITAEVSEDGKQIQMTTAGEEAHVGFWVEVCRMENEEEIYLRETGFDIWNLKEFYNIEPTSLENPEIGEALNLSDLTIVYYNAENPKGKKLSADESNLYVMDYDGNVWEPSEDLEENPLPEFTRRNREGGHIRIAAKAQLENGWEEVAQRHFWFDGLDYSVWLEDLQEGDHGWVYVDDEVSFHLNMDALADKENYEINFDLGIHQEETQTFVPFENQEGLFETITEDGKLTGIKLQGSAIKAIEDSLAEGGWFWVRVLVTANGQEVYSEWRGVELRETELDYHYNEWGFGMLPEWGHGIDKNLEYWLRDEEHPDGYDGEIRYTDIQVEIIEGEEDALTIYEWEDGNGWSLDAHSYGHAVVTLTHPDVLNPEESIEHSFDVWIGQDVWDISLDANTKTDNICPGASMDLRADVAHHCYNEEEGHFDGDTEHVTYEWGYTDGANQELIDFETEGNVLHITAKEDAEYDENTCVYVRVYQTDESGNIMEDEEGNQIEVGYADFWINIRRDYSEIQPLEISKPLELGESREITPVLYFVGESGKTEWMENIVFEWEWNAEEVEIRDSEGNVLTPNENGRSSFGTGTYTLKKLVSWDTNIWLRAWEENDGEYFEVSNRHFWLQDMDYHSWFEDDRGEDWFTFVFEYETEYKIPLNVDSMRDENGDLKENITLEWTVGQFDEEGNVTRELTEGKEYTLNKDKTELILNGQALKESGYKDELSGFNYNLAAKVVVKSNGIPTTDEPYELMFYVHHDCLELEDDGIGDTLAIPGWGWYYPENSIWAYVQNSNYPNGEDIQLEIRNITTNAVDDGEGEVFEIIHEEDGTWRIEPRRCGEAEVTYTLYHESMGVINVSRNKVAADEIYSMGLLSDTHTWQMLTEDELQMMIFLNQYTMDEEGNAIVEKVPAERYELRFDYNPDLITIDETGKVTSHNWYDSTGVHIEAAITMLDGENIYTTGNNTQIHVTPEYAKLSPKTLYMEPDEIVNVEDIEVYRVHISEENREGEQERVDEFEIYPGAGLQLSEDGKTLSFVGQLSEEELPAYLFMDYKVYYEDYAEMDYMSVVVCRHDMSEWETKNEPTSTEEGLEIRTCEHCGMVEEHILESIKPVEPVKKDEWKQDSKGWWYSYAEGGYPANCWKQIDGKWYWFDASGYMKTGWLNLNNQWYYLNGSGVMVTGWNQIGGNWYYFNASGLMATGWLKLNNQWYYLNSSGAMATGWKQIGGSWYYFNAGGLMATGWLKLGTTWYYLKANGVMAVGQIRIDGRMNAFSNSGVWLGYR